MTVKGLSIYERFERKVAVDANGCWIWTGTISSGYGNLRLTPSKSERAHRLSWELHMGPIPAGLRVLHKCDVPACCNPGHLFIGTQMDNVRDMHEKGRDDKARGERHCKAVITEEMVREIRSSNELTNVLAIRLGVSRDVIRKARSRVTWKHVA